MASLLDRLKICIESRGGSYTENDNGWINTNCPTQCHAHGDQNASLGIKELASDQDATETRIWFNCFVGCSPDEILKAYGLTWKDAYSKPSGNFASFLRSARKAQEAPTIFDLEQYVLLPRQYLMLQANIEEKHVFTLHDGDGKSYREVGFKIPYYNQDGTEHERSRIRKRLKKPAQGRDTRFLWSEGDEHPIAYGLQKLDGAERAGYLVIVEGESDTWTLDYHGIPALGVPGATDMKVLDGALLKRIPTIYVIQEKTDQAGINFPYKVQEQLRNTGYTGTILRVPLRTLTGAKDPSELHKKLWNKENPLGHDAFRARFQEARDQAKPMDYDTGKTEEQQEDIKKLDDAIEKRDLAELLKYLPLLARMGTEYLLYEKRIKASFAKDLNMNEFKSALAKERKIAELEQESLRKAEDSNVEYEATDTGMIYSTRSGEPVWISNFTAQILSDITTDDGAEKTRSYEITSQLYTGRRKTFEVSAKDFAIANWVDEHIGAKARITTGQSMKSHLINAIKYCSDPIEQFHYAHTGWRNIDGAMVYLHADGCVSQVSQVEQEQFQDLTQKSKSDGTAYKATSERKEETISQVSQENRKVRVKLTGALSHFLLPVTDADLKTAIRSSLRILDIAPDSITMPLYSSLWRSVLGEVDYGVHLAGQTGWGKTELVALLQQHFGSLMDARKLPGSWESTENSLEMLLFQAKDAIVVVDDFKPKGGKSDQDRLHAKADRIFRQLGNGSARGRLTSNLEQRAERRPRCLLISTGEDVPRGQSLKARGVVLTMNERLTIGEPAKKLSEAQRDARSGLYASAMAAYIEWLVPQIETIQSQLPGLVAEERDRLSIEGHGRAGTNTANMLLGMKSFLRFACECGSITEQEAKAYLSRCITALRQIAKEADSENNHDKPSEQWRRLLVAALTSKSAHLVNPDGENPGLEYGWIKSIRETTDRDGSFVEEPTFRGGGSPIGWIEDNDIYLLPAAAYKAARAIGSQTGDDITTLEPTLRKFLNQDKLLASTDLDKARNTITVRRRLQRLQREVLHIKVCTLFPSDSLPNSDDSLDLPDSEPHEPASEDGSEVSQVHDKKSRESSHTLDSEADIPILTPENTANYPYDVIPTIGSREPNRPCMRCQHANWLPWYSDGQWQWQCGDCNPGLRSSHGRDKFFVEEQVNV